MVLGTERESATGIQVPGRMADLSNLPPAYINVGECEVFRDSAVAYASKIWSVGGSCELHVWPGVYHGGMSFEPHVPVSQAAAAAEMEFMRRALGFPKGRSGHARDVGQASL
jgi:acetyl esterase/lipase